MPFSTFKFIDTRNILSAYESGFFPGDSCVHQRYLIVREINNALDANPSLEVRGVFLFISIKFRRVWLKALLYKLVKMRIFKTS